MSNRNHLLLLSVFLGLNLLLVAVLFLDIPQWSLKQNTVAGNLSGIQNITASLDVRSRVFVGEPFNYTVRIDYKPGLVKPDFSKLLRNIQFSPFEQIQNRSVLIKDSEISADVREYTLSYPIQGVKVVPHSQYPLAAVKLPYSDLTDNKDKSLTIVPHSIYITGYYPEDVTGIPFRPLEGAVSDYLLPKRIAIGLSSLLFLILGSLIIRSVVMRGDTAASSRLRELQRLFNFTREHTYGRREKILLYEKIFLTLLIFWRKQSAYNFWLKKDSIDNPYWKEKASVLREKFETAYARKKSEDMDAESTEESLEQVFRHINDEEIDAAIKREQAEDTLGKRIRRHRRTFIGGIASIMIAAVFFAMLVKPSIWESNDVAVYNHWIHSIPPRMLTGNGSSHGSMDIELLSDITQPQNVLEKLKSVRLKGAYLYNYGTAMAKASAGGGTTSNNQLTVSQTSLRFPVMLLSNSVRYYPYDEDARRNLELAVMLLQKERKKKVEITLGNSGPPTPGFSRNLSEVLF